MAECNFAEDAYISVDVAISQIRDEVPSLMCVIRERVDTISQTRAELEELVGRVEQQKVITVLHVLVRPSSYYQSLFWAFLAKCFE